MKSLDKTVIFYDRDGGGLGAHVQHYLQTALLSETYGLDVADFYPYTRDILKLRLSRSIDPISLSRALKPSECADLDRMLSLAQSASHLRELISSSHCQFLLTGQHTYNKNLSSLFPGFDSRVRANLLRSLVKTASSIESIIDFINESGFRDDANYVRSQHQFSVTMHLRTIRDSEEGYARFKHMESEFTGWYLDLLGGMGGSFLSRCIINIFSDCNISAVKHEKVLIQNGFKTCLRSSPSFVHTSLARVIGRELLLPQSRSWEQELDLVRLEHKLTRHAIAYSAPTLVEMVMMSSGDYFTGMGSSFGALARCLRANMPFSLFDTHYINGTCIYTGN